MLVVSHLCEQQLESLVQEPSFAIQQVPLLHIWPPEQLETQALLPGSHCRHWLASQGAVRQVAPQALALSQHPVLVQVLPVGQPGQGVWPP
ncbi:MAG: hypothetical protein DME32_16940 [Verrucomicrobia bacterium]|nr:MAG: hypothetical protein DME32_16940 [Verrucomicrobiota bacterium]